MIHIALLGIIIGPSIEPTMSQGSEVDKYLTEFRNGGLDLDSIATLDRLSNLSRNDQGTRLFLTGRILQREYELQVYSPKSASVNKILLSKALDRYHQFLDKYGSSSHPFLSDCRVYKGLAYILDGNGRMADVTVRDLGKGTPRAYERDPEVMIDFLVATPDNRFSVRKVVRSEFAMEQLRREFSLSTSRFPDVTLERIASSFIRSLSREERLLH